MHESIFPMSQDLWNADTQIIVLHADTQIIVIRLQTLKSFQETFCPEMFDMNPTLACMSNLQSVESFGVRGPT